jgi:methanol metabolism-related c-type cytochrome
MRRVCVALILASALGWGGAVAETAKTEKDGKWVKPDGSPTFNIASDGTVDWYTFSGYRRYHSVCHTCHGPDGEGSTYAPNLVEPLKTMSYPEFMLIVAAGKQEIRTDKQAVMPAFGNDPNVRCFIDDIFVYLKARAVGGLPRGRPAKHADKPEAADKHEKECFGAQ